MKRLIVKLVNAGHGPFDTRIFQKEAKTLSQAGHVVTIIVPHSESLTKDGIEIIAVPFPKKGWQKLVVSPWHIFRKALSQPTNCIFHVHDSELLLVALWLKLLGRKVIYDAHEDTPRQIQYQHWIPSLLKWPYATFYFLLEKICGWLFDRVIVAEPIIAQYFPQRKTILIRNFPLLESFKHYGLKPYPQRLNEIIYVGLISIPRGLNEMIHALEKIQDRCNTALALGGKFSPASLEQEISGKVFVKYLGWIDYEKLPETLNQYKIGIIIPQPNPRYTTNYPVKLFEYMAAGLPVIASSKGDSAEFVKEADCGILVDPLNSEEIEGAILKLLSDSQAAEEMGLRGRKLVFEKYNWEIESKKLLEIYDSI